MVNNCWIVAGARKLRHPLSVKLTVVLKGGLSFHVAWTENGVMRHFTPIKRSDMFRPLFRGKVENLPEDKFRQWAALSGYRTFTF